MPTLMNILASGGVATAAMLTPTASQAAARDIVLVHGLGSDGSVWRPVYEILKARGYTVSIVQQPLNGLRKT